MKSKKLIATLGNFLDQKKRKKRKHLDELKVLLAKLETKKTALQEKIALADDKRKQTRLNKEADVIDAQLTKGYKALRKLEEPSPEDSPAGQSNNP